MLKRKGFIGVVSALVIAMVLIITFVVDNGKCQVEANVGVVDMEAIFTQVVAPPLIEARDQLQAEYEEKSETLSEDEQKELLDSYQQQLYELELQQWTAIENALDKVGQRHDFEIIVESGAVLYGGVDVTAEVLEELK
ncbi:MAG: hypothetical protein GX020_07895 [Firmicutes bacterium]|nr:hypothetical protein [Bacillota bacterium]